MKISKALITAAGTAQRQLPLQTLVDRDGAQKSALQILIEEALSAGISEVGLVVAPGYQAAYSAAAGPHTRRLKFVEQTTLKGYGGAILSAMDFIGGDPVLHLVCDHLCVSAAAQTCAQQLVEVATAQDCAVSAVQATREPLLPNYGAVGGKRVTGVPRLYSVDQVLEKPTPTEAEQSLIVPGLRAGFYLCFFGMHVLTPGVIQLLSAAAKQGAGPLGLSPSLGALARQERYLALEVLGQRYDIGAKYGLLTAQLALALGGQDRADVLASLVELLATGQHN